jgi:hypothetical protein
VSSGFFYWIPSMVDFPGLDGVLGNTGYIYAMRAAIADDHSTF